MKTPKGKILKYRPLRPTRGMVKEAIFDILRSRMKNVRFLDLYAGSGAVGLKALEQGAGEVVFVEANKNYGEKIRQIIQKRKITEKTHVVIKKTLQFIAWAELKQLTFDIIFLDPPYHTDEIEYALSAIGKSHILLRQDGVVIAEHFTKRQLSERFGRLQKVKDYNYGDTVLSLYKRIQRS